MRNMSQKTEEIVISYMPRNPYSLAPNINSVIGVIRSLVGESAKTFVVKVLVVNPIPFRLFCNQKTVKF